MCLYSRIVHVSVIVGFVFLVLAFWCIAAGAVGIGKFNSGISNTALCSIYVSQRQFIFSVKVYWQYLLRFHKSVQNLNYLNDLK